MANSQFLAQLIGPMLIILGLSILFNPSRIRAIGQEFLDSDGLMFTSGILASVTGLALVITHNLWTADWRVLITIFGWIALMAGAGRLLFPTQLKTIGGGMLDHPVLITVPAILMSLMGAWLSYQGFFA